MVPDKSSGSPATGPAEAGVRRTSDWVAAVRAEEYRLPDRFIADPYAEMLIDAEAVATMQQLRELGGPAELIPLRGRLGDEALRHAVAAGTRQAVCLGAGADTRAWRLGLPGDFSYFEVDLPGQSSAKARQLAVTAGARPSCRWYPVEADVRAAWPDALAAAGMRVDLPVLWIIEGLVFYLASPEARELVRVLGIRSAPGSAVVGDVLDSALFAHPLYQPFLAQMAALGIVLTPHDEFVQWLQAAGWRAQVYRIDDLAAGAHPLLREPLPERLHVAQPGVGYFFGTRPEQGAEG